MEVEHPQVLIKLVSADDKEFLIPKRSICSQLWGSNYISTLLGENADLEDSSSDSEDESKDESQAESAVPTIPLTAINSTNLSKIVEYCVHHTDNPMKPIAKPLQDEDLSKIVDAWDAKFVDLTLDELSELVIAANFLDVSSLIELLCAKIATFIKGKTEKQIRETFGIEKEFTEEELNEIKEKHPWLEEL